MTRQIKDPGLGSKYKQGERRLLNKDGTFNVKKEGIPGNIRDTYQMLIIMSWGRFLLLISAFILALNLTFAIIYVVIGVQGLAGNIAGGFWQNLKESLYFSFQTFTTVGYGHISPTGKLANIIAFLESTTGLMVFAIITGLLYGRFSKPSMRLLYSKNALIAPYKNGWALMFRVINLRKSILLEMNANVSLTIHDKKTGEYLRKYFRLPLEIDRIEFFPANWTIVHPINEDSPFNDLDLANLAREEIEIIIQLKGFDDTFSQHVHSRTSYLSTEIVVGAKFKQAYFLNEKDEITIPVNFIHEYEIIPYS